MTLTDLFNAIRGRFKTQCADVLGYPVAYPNVEISEPEDAPWLQCAVLPGESIQVDAGGSTNRYRTVGVLIANVFGPIRQGENTVLAAAETIRAAFRGVTASGVTYRTPKVQVVGRTAGKWWQVAVTCPWFTDELA